MVKHLDRCLKFKGVKAEMPKKGRNIINFTNYSLQLEAPYCIYADFESVMKQKSEVKSIHEISG